jgi:beta-alanine--pyruvate transaminase
MNLNDAQHLSPAPRTDAAWLAAHWMPFTGNRDFKAHPRMMTGAPRAPTTPTPTAARCSTACRACGAPAWATAGARSPRRWAARPRTLDYSPAFQFGHPLSFELANRIVERMPAGLNRVFFTGSGSEAADTSLKMARAYWRTKGQASKTRLIGREKGYHGVNFGGISVGGIVANRKPSARGSRPTTCRTPSRRQQLLPRHACRRQAPNWPTNCST